MAKKRKLVPKSGEAQKQKLKKQEQEQEQGQEEEQQVTNQVKAEDPVTEVEEEEEEDDEETEIEGEAEEEDQTVKQEENDDVGEPIHKLLEPFSKEQLINILTEAAEKHAQVAARVRKVADEDPVHRKIFVHGLGWETTTESLKNFFVQFGEIEDCKAVSDKATGKSKGYGFILFKSRTGASKALKEPQKKIGNRFTSCQLAATGPVPASGASGSTQAAAVQQPVSEYTQRKIYVSNVGPELDSQKLYTYFAKFGEIEEGPLGLDKQTGRPKGFCLFVYKTVEGARKALEEPHKNFDGNILHCQQANDGFKSGKQNFNQQRNPQFGRNNSQTYANSVGGLAAGGGGQQMMGQSISANIPYNHGVAAAPAAAFNPAILTALLSSQNGLGLQNLLNPLGAGMAPVVPGGGQGMQGGYGNQAVGSGVNLGMLGGYGAQAGLQSAYSNQQQGGSRTQHGSGHTPYTGR